ncbi:hypothetical protein Efla_006224 [Eimeria flavescens]
MLASEKRPSPLLSPFPFPFNGFSSACAACMLYPRGLSRPQQRHGVRRRNCLVLVLLTVLLFFSPASAFQILQPRSSLSWTPLLRAPRASRLQSAAAQQIAADQQQRGAFLSSACPSPSSSLPLPPKTTSSVARSSLTRCYSSSSSSSFSLPFWGEVFSRKLLFSERLPAALSPLHAALFARANLAARRFAASGFLGFFSGQQAAGGPKGLLAAAAAASLAAFGSWRLLSIVSRSLRDFTARHRLAESRVYGPLHSLDATLKPIIEGPPARSKAAKAQQPKPPQTSSSSSSGSSSSKGKKHLLKDQDDSSGAAPAGAKEDTHAPAPARSSNTGGSSSSGSSSSSSRAEKKASREAAEDAGTRKAAKGSSGRRRSKKQQNERLADSAAVSADGLDQPALQLTPEAA